MRNGLHAFHVINSGPSVQTSVTNEWWVSDELESTELPGADDGGENQWRKGAKACSVFTLSD